MIPIFNPRPQYESLKDSINQALIDVAASGQYILGPQVEQFEKEFATAVGANHTIGVNSGTDALYIALKALGVGPGDDVITTPFSYIATSESIARTGAYPIFVDIDPYTYNIDPGQIEDAITDNTKAIVPVHLYGQACDMTQIMAIAERYKLYVVEDCAQAAGATWHGETVGSIGDIGCFSFFPTKNLGALGDAGAMTTSDEEIAPRLRSLRVHGATPDNRYDHKRAGINSRLDTMQAAVLLAKLPYLEEWNTERRRIAQYYTETIQNSPLAEHLTVPAVTAQVSMHAFHQYTIRLKKGGASARNAIQEELKNQGVTAMIYYPIPLHLQKTHAKLGYAAGDFPEAEAAANEVLSLPIFPGLTREEQDTVIKALEKACTPILV